MPMKKKKQSAYKITVITIISIFALVIIFESIALFTQRTNMQSFQLSLTPVTPTEKATSRYTRTPTPTRRVTTHPTATRLVIYPPNPSPTPGTTTLEIPAGKILFRNFYEKQSASRQLYIVNGDGGWPQYIGNYTGSATFSPDGRFIATGCDDIKSVCIVDTSPAFNARVFPFPENAYYDTNRYVYMLDLPDGCIANINYLYGVISISWSFDQNKLAVVCGQMHEGPNSVCILNFNGNSYCWDSSKSENVFRAVWSPVEDVLAIDDAEKIYIVDPNGNDRQFVVEGTSPEWSPDGNRIAFISSGIGIINKNGAGSGWIFENSYARRSREESILFSCYEDTGTSCRLAWSPDGRYIIFIAQYLSPWNWDLFRYDIRTNEIVRLISGFPYSRSISEADWGP